MAHKVRATIRFKDMEEYQLMQEQLFKAGWSIDQFATHSVSLVWNQMIEEYKRQVEEQNELNSKTAINNPPGISMGDSSNTP